MSGVVTYLVRDGVAIIEIDNPPLNALSAVIRRELDSALDRAGRDGDVAAIVLRARGRTFGAGTDPNASAPTSNAPPLDALCAHIDASPKPVIAALHGSVLGNGADIALAAHYRVAQSGTHLGFPEVRLGLLPSGGATQRLPRLVGAKTALAMLQAGRAVPVSTSRRNGLADRLVHDKTGVASFALAKELIGQGAHPRPVGSRGENLSDPASFLDAVAEARGRLVLDALPVHAEIINSVEAALLLPLEEGLAFEQAARDGLRVSDISSALRHMARAERRATLLPTTLNAEPRKTECIGIYGGGSAAIGLATACLKAEFAVVLSAPDEAGLEDAYAGIGEVFDARVAAGQMTEDEVDIRLDRLTMVCGFQAFAAADVVIDTQSTETPSAIETIAHMDTATPAGAIFVVSASGVALDAVARSTSRPGDVLGLRLFGSAIGGAGAEIVTTPDTSRHATATAFAFARKLDKLAVRSVDAAAGGGIAARLVAALHAAADALVARGAAPDAIDSALRDWGMTEGVFEARQRRGLPVPQQAAPMPTEGNAALDVHASKPAQFPAPRKLSAETITRACLAAVVNEGAKLLTEGVARVPSDIDVLAVHGLGYRRRTGGPMQAGDAAGLLSLRRALPRLGEHGGIGGKPEALLDDLIKNGRGFDSLNAG